MRGITRDCIVELTARKSFWLYIILTVLMVLSLVVAGQLSFDSGAGDFEDIGGVTFSEFRAATLIKVFDVFIWIFVVLTVFITAGQIPRMLTPGRAEFYLSKPISKSSLYFNKLFGILLTYGGMIFLCGLIGWATIYLVGSVSSVSFLYFLLLNIAALFIWLSITGFAGIASGSTSLAIVAVAVVWFIQFALRARELLQSVVSAKAVHTLLDILYYIFPKTGQIDSITTAMVAGQPIGDWMPLWSSLLFSVALVFITVIIFKRKNY